MSLLILGGGGRLGRLLRSVWPDRSATIWHGGTDADLQFDILADPDALSDAISQASSILLLAGVTQDRQDRPFSTNTALAQAVLDAADGKPVLLASSASIYGRARGVLTEDMPPMPESDYGKSKHAMEQLAGKYPNTTCLRIGNVAGADALLGTARETYMLDQFSDGTYPMRSYIGPGLLAQVISGLNSKVTQGTSLPHILNIACPDPISMANLLDAAAKNWRATPAPNTAIKTVHMDTTRLWDLLPKPNSSAADIVTDWRSSVGQM